MWIFILSNWRSVVAGIGTAVVVAPIAFWLGSWQGAREERAAEKLRVEAASAKNDVATATAITEVKEKYVPVYIEVEKYVEVPKCPVPPVIDDILGRLPEHRPADQPGSGGQVQPSGETK